MRYSTGQIVKCIRVIENEKSKLVGCVGEIREVMSAFQTMLYGGHYVVFFPAYPSGMCPHCREVHDPLFFLMWHQELGPVDDPDAGTVERVVRFLEEVT